MSLAEKPTLLSVLGAHPTNSTTSQWSEWNTIFLRMVRSKTTVRGELTTYITHNDQTNIIEAPLLPNPLPINTEGDRILAIHKYLHVTYTAQQSALAEIETDLHTYTSETVKATVISELGGHLDALETHTLPQIYAALTRRFGNTSAADLAQLRNDLQHSFTHENKDSLPNFTNNQSRIFAKFAQAHNPISENQKITYLIEAINKSPSSEAFKSTIFTFLSTNHDLANPARTYAALVHQLLIANTIVSIPPPVLTQTYAYTATAQTAQTARASSPSQSSANAKPTRSSTSNRSSSPAPRVRFQDSPATHYCWTHGTGYHSSNHCKYRREGHQTQATAVNIMGGVTPRATETK